jgi:proteasome lid subunit RPN8/RPN11
VIRQAREAVPNEMVGLFVRRQGQVDSLLLPVHATPSDFEASKDCLVQISYAVLDTRAEVIGTYHSHPADIPAFSTRDTGLMEWGKSHLLISGLVSDRLRLLWGMRISSERADGIC